MRVKQAATGIWILKAFLLLAAGLGLPDRSAAAVTLNPGPGDNAVKSDKFRVEVKVNGVWRESYTYKASRKSGLSQWRTNQFPTVSFTTFHTDSRAEVRVLNLSGSTSTYQISPKSKKIAGTLTNGILYFQLSPGDKVRILVNGNDLDTVYVFCDGPKAAVPTGARVFPAGYHTIGAAYEPPQNSTIYLDSGAYVHGMFRLNNSNQVTIMGPGILSGENWPAEQYGWRQDFSLAKEYVMIRNRGGSGGGHRVRDITIINTPYYLFFGGGFSQIGNTKGLSPWVYSTDGYAVVNSSREPCYIRNNFIFNADDVFFPRMSSVADIIAENNFVIANGNHVFNLGYWADNLTPGKSFIARNIDISSIITQKHEHNAIFGGTVDGDSSQKGYHNQTFEDIRIEGSIPSRLFAFKHMQYTWSPNNNPELGNVRNIKLRNVTLEGTQGSKSLIMGKDTANGHHDYLFESLSINGVVVTEANKNQYFVFNDFVNNVVFREGPAAKQPAPPSALQLLP